jgi:formylglycine-generating enzyme required for sulfatase activity
MPAQEPNTDPTLLPTPVTSDADGHTQRQVGAPTHLSRPDESPSVDGYELGREIARGGMGVVYAARDLSLDREVAVKVMLPRMSAAEFERESKVTARLPHPGVPPVYALGTLPAPDGRPFLAMKLIKGETLTKILADRPDPSADRGKLVVAFEQMCQAVGYAHAQGIVHRDLKPDNVMVGAFGEVQVMDWGLAKAFGAADADATAPDAGVQTFSADAAATVAGQVKGTPAYMAPEQARGEPVDPRADVFALGGILAAILTGKPPFTGTSVLDTIIRAASGDLADILARLDECGADEELVEVAKRCLSARAEERPATGEEVASVVAAYRTGVDARLQQAERDRAVSVAEVREQRKRRRVLLILAGVVMAVLAGAGIASALVIEQRAEKQQEADRLANEKQRAEDKLVAETKRQNDLRAADAAAQEQQRAAQRETRAGALVDALSTAETVSVPRVVNDLTEYRDLTGAKLRELAGRPVGTKPGLHARLALLADEPTRAAELAAYLPACKSEELLTIRDALKPHAEAVTPGLWAVLTDGKADAGKRVRAACALAGLAPDDERWTAVAPVVSDLVVLENPLAAAVWFEALEPVRGALVPALVKRYPEARGRLRGGKLDEVQLAAEVSGYDLTATALARYTGDRPAEAAEQMLLMDPRHAAQFVPAVSANKVAVVPTLKAELAKTGSADGTDEQHEALGRRRAQAAAVLLTLGEAESVWPVFAFPKDGDPTVRSYLLARLVDLGTDPLALMGRFEVEPDVSAKRGLLVALGGFPVDVVPVVEREALAGRLLTLYREHPDPGLHGAIDWVLRQKWGKAKELAAIDAEWAAAMRGKVLARGLADLAPVLVPVGPLLPAPPVAVGKDWFVNGEGQTYTVVRGPVEFTLGSPKTEPGRVEVNEPPHRKRIGRTFAIVTKEVTVEQFLRFRPKHDWVKRYSPGPDTPAMAVTWYDAAAYCNWLSEREGIPESEWCYEPSKAGEFGEGMRMKVGHLKLTGYRLPTEAEWEYACRGGAVTARYHGRGEDLLPRYGWFAKNAEDRAWPVGRLRPNELGLFDMLGNALEWVKDPALEYVTGQIEDIENIKLLIIDERMSYILRGASFLYQPVSLRCASRNIDRAGNRNSSVGFRPVRTLLN